MVLTLRKLIERIDEYAGRAHEGSEHKCRDCGLVKREFEWWADRSGDGAWPLCGDCMVERLAEREAGP